MTRLLHFAWRISKGALLLACASVIGIWIASYWWSPVGRWQAGGQGVHVAVRGGVLWVTRGGQADALPGARPIIVIKGFEAALRRANDAERSLREHAEFLRRRLGSTDPEAAAEVARADEIRASIHKDMLTRIEGPRCEPIVAASAPMPAAWMGIAFETGTARFPVRGSDGVIAYGPPMAFSATGIPCWMLAVALGFIPALSGGLDAWRDLRRLRARPGTCPQCGYDMRATPGRCPECGLAPMLVVFMFVALSSAAPARADEWPADDLAREAIAHNQKTRALLKQVALAMTSSRDDQPDLGIALLKYKGTWRYADWHPPGGNGPLDRHIQAVFNDAYFAFTLGYTGPVLYQYEWDGSAASRDLLRNQLTAHMPHDPLAFAFGNGSQTLPEAIDSYREHFQARAETFTDAAGRRLIRMNVYSAKDSGPSDARWFYDFDPACGYAITHMGAGGLHPFMDYQVDLQPVPGVPGAWIPEFVRRYRYQWGSSTPSVTEHDILQILPDADLSDRAFRIAALRLMTQQRFFRMPAGASTGVGLTLVDGVWMQDPFATQLLRPGGTVGAVGPKWPGMLAAALLLIGITVVLALKRAGRFSG